MPVLKSPLAFALSSHAVENRFEVRGPRLKIRHLSPLVSREKQMPENTRNMAKINNIM